MATGAPPPPLSPHLNILWSYFYFQEMDLAPLIARTFGAYTPRIFADSGAFSAWSLGKPISVEAYADWLHQNKACLTVYANLDVKGDVDAGLRNQRYLEDRGLSPIPVYHGGEPLSVLEDMCQHYPYIALGGIAGGFLDEKLVRIWLAKAFAIGQGRSVFHGFGMSNLTHLRLFPFFSSDSTSWCSGFRFGKVPVFVWQTGKMEMLAVGNRADGRRLADAIRSYGLDPLDFSVRSRNVRQKLATLAVASYQRAEAYLRRIHGPITIPQREDLGACPQVHIAGSHGKSLWPYAEAVTGIENAGRDGAQVHLAQRWNHAAYCREAVAGIEAAGPHHFVSNSEPTSQGKAAMPIAALTGEGSSQVEQQVGPLHYFANTDPAHHGKAAMPIAALTGEGPHLHLVGAPAGNTLQGLKEAQHAFLPEGPHVFTAGGNPVDWSRAAQGVAEVLGEEDHA